MNKEIVPYLLDLLSVRTNDLINTKNDLIKTQNDLDRVTKLAKTQQEIIGEGIGIMEKMYAELTLAMNRHLSPFEKQVFSELEGHQGS